jgi:hypothetical protein
VNDGSHAAYHAPVTPWWVPLLSSLAASLVTLGGVIATLIVQGKREQQRWLNEREARRIEREAAKSDRLRTHRVDLWMRAMKAVNRLQDNVAVLTFEGDADAFSNAEPDLRASLAELESLDPEMRLLAPQAFLEGWHAMVITVGMLVLRVAHDSLDTSVTSAAEEARWTAKGRSAAQLVRENARTVAEALRASMRQIDTE